MIDPSCLSGRQLALKSAQPLLELRHGEVLTERVEDVVGALPVAAESTKLTPEDGGVERDGFSHSPRRERWCDLDLDFAAIVDRSRPELDGGSMSLSDRPDAHHKAQAARG